MSKLITIYPILGIFLLSSVFRPLGVYAQLETSEICPASTRIEEAVPLVGSVSVSYDKHGFVQFEFDFTAEFNVQSQQVITVDDCQTLGTKIIEEWSGYFFTLPRGKITLRPVGFDNFGMEYAFFDGQGKLVAGPTVVGGSFPNAGSAVNAVQSKGVILTIRYPLPRHIGFFFGQSDTIAGGQKDFSRLVAGVATPVVPFRSQTPGSDASRLGMPDTWYPNYCETRDEISYLGTVAQSSN